MKIRALRLSELKKTGAFDLPGKTARNWLESWGGLASKVKSLQATSIHDPPQPDRASRGRRPGLRTDYRAC